MTNLEIAILAYRELEKTAMRIDDMLNVRIELPLYIDVNGEIFYYEKIKETELKK